jgi:hypothetical protein
LQAMAAEILRYRHVGHVCFHCLPTDSCPWKTRSRR